MDNKLSEEELKKIKEQLRKEVEAELKEKSKKKTTNKKAKGTSKTTTKTSVKKSTSNKKEVKEEQKVEFKIPPKKKQNYFSENNLKETKKTDITPINEDSKTSPVLLIIILILMTCGILILPKIHTILSSNVKQDKIEDKKEEEPTLEKVEYNFTDESIKNLVFPVMRSNKYDPTSYYQIEKLDINGLSNNDILYNAFLDIYPDFITNYEEEYLEGACIDPSMYKTFKVNYLDVRIKNLFTKSIEYYHTDFYVPSNVDSQYPGLWRYDASNNRYIYYGDCTPNPMSDSEYYDIKIEKDIKTSEDFETVYLTYYMAFAKVNNGVYTLYKDANYENEIASGEYVSMNNLKAEAINYKKYLKTYKYIFSNSDCTYEGLCYIGGSYDE